MVFVVKCTELTSDKASDNINCVGVEDYFVRVHFECMCIDAITFNDAVSIT